MHNLYFTVILKSVNGSERMGWGEQKLNACFPVSPDNCTAPVLRALLFSASVRPHALYTCVCCEDNHREAMTSVTRIFLESAAFDEI